YVRYYNETILNVISLSLFVSVWKDIKYSDIAHIQSIFSTSTLISLFYAKLLKKPIVLSPRGSLGAWCIDSGSKFKSIWLYYLLRPLVKNITWHATAEQEKGEILSIYPCSNVSIVPNGIEFEKFQNSTDLSSKEYMEKFTGRECSPGNVIVSMGRLEKKKGFDILINSFQEVLKLSPISVLLIAGPDQGEMKNLVDQIERLKLEDSVFLIGAISGQDKIDFLANANLFCLPSHNENFGNVYVESLAAGTPIVTSTNTPWSEVEKADCGKWVSNSIENTSQAILEMLEKDRMKMRFNSRALAEIYAWENIATQFKDLFEKVIQSK
ncbi:glycosyltransferase, partial [Amylibacter sp.]|nr:glycosyltransferase [Amylibacter sp.]